MRTAFLLAALALVGLSACSSPTEPTLDAGGLPCANTVTPPDRFLVPHRYTDSTALVVSIGGDPWYGRTLGYIERGWPVAERHCLTVADSIAIHAK
jgi:hypothetical protein